MEKSLSSLRELVDRNTLSIERNEKVQRQRNLRFYGIPFSPNENLNDIFKDICLKGLKMPQDKFEKIGIDNIHRVDRDKACIIIAFISRIDKNYLMSCKTNLKDYKYNEKPVFISDDLTVQQNKDRKNRNAVYKRLLAKGKNPSCAGNFYIILNGKKYHYSYFDADMSDDEIDDDIENALNAAGTSNA